jgi:hypothetical protein
MVGIKDNIKMEVNEDVDVEEEGLIRMGIEEVGILDMVGDHINNSTGTEPQVPMKPLLEFPRVCLPLPNLQKVKKIRRRKRRVKRKI